MESKRIIAYMGHPAHYHLLKNVVANLRNEGNQVEILIKKKDVLEELLKNDGLEYHNILEEGRKNTKLGILWGTIKRAWRLFVFCLKFKPSLLIGTSVENSWIGPLLGIKVINVNEDDASVVPLYAKLSYPGATSIMAPVSCNCGKWEKKTVHYASFHELAYLHPNHFCPSAECCRGYGINPDETFFVFRFASLKAHHDTGIRGISSEIAQHLIDQLKPFGKIYITSERELEPQFEQYRIHIRPIDMHNVMAFASLYIGDSQTMAAEAGVLGVPFVRFNDFVGRIGYLKELEERYELGYGIRTNDVQGLYSRVDALLAIPDRKTVFQNRRQKLLEEKIDYAKFLTWFIENYPKSRDVMAETPDYQYRFR